MLIDLPRRSEARRRAMAWLVAERVPYLALFQQVKVHSDQDGARFKAWMAETKLNP